jgi:thiamine transporter
VHSRPVRTAAEIGLSIALATVLQFIAVWQMPQGGSVSLGMLPLFVLALLRGPRVGLVAGALYGLVDLMMKPYIFHPVQVVLDYPLAYGLCGLAGLFSARWLMLAGRGEMRMAALSAMVPGTLIGALGLYAAHVVSGLVFFAEYAIEAGQAPLAYLLAYNSFVLVSAAAVALVAAAVLPAVYPIVTRTRP